LGASAKYTASGEGGLVKKNGAEWGKKENDTLLSDCRIERVKEGMCEKKGNGRGK